MKLKNTSKKFTLIELVVAMGVFSVLMAVLMQFFSSAQNLWLRSSQNVEIYQNARVLVDVMTRDLQCVLYNNNDDSSGMFPFWYESESRINFISATDMRSTNAKSPICILKYAWANGATNVYTNGFSGAKVDADSANQINWIVRSCTCDTQYDADTPQSAPKYNYMDYPRRSVAGVKNANRAEAIFKEVGSVASTEDFQYMIPYVVNFSIACKGVKYTLLNDDSISCTSSPDDSVSPLPSVVIVSFSLLDKTNWDKWIAMGGNRSNPDGDSAAAKAFRESKQVNFSFSVYLNNRLSQ